MDEYKENQIFGKKHEEIFKKIGIPLGRSYGSSMRKYKDINLEKYECVYFWFCHKKGRSTKKIFYNHLTENMIIMEKMLKSYSNPPLWKNSNPKIVFYDDNEEIGKPPLYKFKGIYKISHSEADDSKVYLKKIGSKLLVDRVTKTVSWR